MTHESSKPIRVLHVISGDLWAGAEVMAFNLLRYLASTEDIALHVAVLNQGQLADNLRARGIPLTVIDESRLNSLNVLRSLLRLARDFKPQIVHTHRQKENILGSIVAFLLGSKSLRTVHGWTETKTIAWRVDKRLLAMLDRLTGRHLQQRVVAVSGELAGKLETTFRPELIRTIENGVDVNALRQSVSDDFPISLDSQAINIGMIARLVAVKGHARLIHAAKLVESTMPGRFQFHLFGDGPESSTISDQITSLGLSKVVHVHGFRNDIPAILGALDGIMICSDHEGLPINALEAAALGVPIVTTPLPSLKTILSSGVSGVIAEDWQPSSIAKVLQLIGKRHLITEYPDLREWRYSADTMARAYENLYQEILA